MRLDHSNYIKLVIGTYKKKRANNELSPLLAQSTPANIRRECANVYQERYDKKDDPTLRAFFGPVEPGRKFLAAIQEFKATKFKPLDNYLKETGNKKLNDRNLELLAWLIDFKHRPYVFDRHVLLSDEDLSLLEKPIPVPEPEENDPLEIAAAGAATTERLEELLENGLDKERESNKPVSQASSLAVTSDKAKKRDRKAVIALLILVIFAGVGYVFWQEKQNKQIVMGNTNTGCMYWANDHYEQVPCNEEPKDRLILPLNEEKLKHFKRILREDTITERSVGKIYYLKNNGMEYYTAGGNHPVEVTRSLKKLSLYMFEKHLRKRDTTDRKLVSEENLKSINNR